MTTAPETSPAPQPACTAPGPAANFAALLCRVLLGGLFVAAGLLKLGFVGNATPANFAEAIIGFKVIHYDLVPMTAFAVPWLELICGALLILGLAGRGAALVTAALLLGFTGAVLTLIARDMNPTCSCFAGLFKEHLGAFGQIMESEAGWMTVARNVVMLTMATVVLSVGSGWLALDSFFRCRRTS